MTRVALPPFAVTRGYQYACDAILNLPSGVATLPTRVGGTDDLAIQTDGSDSTYHTMVSGIVSDPDTLDQTKYPDVLSFDFKSPGVTPRAVALQHRWRSSHIGEQPTPTGARSWVRLVTPVGEDVLLERSLSQDGADLGHIFSWDLADVTETSYFWATVDPDNPTDSGNWLEHEVDIDLSAFGGDGLRFSVYMDCANETFPAWVDIMETRLLVELDGPIVPTVRPVLRQYPRPISARIYPPPQVVGGLRSGGAVIP